MINKLQLQFLTHQQYGLWCSWHLCSGKRGLLLILGEEGDLTENG
jgi:hypothetical protein